MLNLHILYDELLHLNPTIESPQKFESMLEYPKILLTKDDFDAQSQVLYVVEAALFDEIVDDTSRYQFVVMGESTHSPIGLINSGTNYVSVDDSVSFSQLFNTVQSIFQKYKAWEERMTHAILNHGSTVDNLFQKILYIGVEMLHNPIALFDISSTLMAYAGSIPEDVSNSIWSEVLETGRYHTEELDRHYRYIIYEAKTYSMEPYYSESYSNKYKENMVVANIIYNDRTIATLGSVDINEEFSNGQISIIDRLITFLELANEHSRNFKMTTEIPNYFVENLIKGKKVENHILEYHLDQLNWKIGDTYVLLDIADVQGNAIPEMELAEVLKHYEEYFTDSIVITYEHSIIFIVHTTISDFMHNKLLKPLLNLISEYKMVVGVSAEFYDFSDLKYAYIQAKSAIKILANHTYLGPISYYEDIHMENIVSTLSEHTSLKSLVHPRVLTLWKNQELTLDNLETLESYLINGQNIVSTARKLYIHRNTLTYRINKLIDLFEMDFAELDDEDVFWMYFSCVILQSIS